MFKLSEIKELIKLIDQSSLQELEIQNDTYKLSLRKPVKTEQLVVAAPSQPAAVPATVSHTAVTAPAPAAPRQDEDDTAGLHRIVSPMVGTFYQSPAPDAPSFVNAGDKISPNTVVCIVEAMKLMNPIEAETKGVIVEVLVENGQLVEYGQPLFLVRPE